MEKDSLTLDFARFQANVEVHSAHYSGHLNRAGGGVVNGVDICSGSFPMSQFFASDGRSIAASASVLPVNIKG